MPDRAPIKILFVCTGNICRSPTAEGVFRHLAEEAGLADRFQLDSAGTHEYHVGMPPDSRATRIALCHGVDISEQRARRIIAKDFERFDYVIAMDQSHKRFMAENLTGGAAAEIRLLMEFAPGTGYLDVPDPYDGDEEDFERTYALIETAVAKLFETLRARLD
jgi:protein-tyrosine phosphatase